MGCLATLFDSTLGTPFFLIFTGYVTLGEKPGSLATFGILLIVAGSYVMNLSKAKSSLLAPFKALFKEKGVTLIFTVAFLYSLTSIAGKLLVKLSSPWFFSVYYTAVMTAILTPAGLKTRKGAKLNRPLLLSGVFFGLMILTHMLAINIAYVSYMIALKRLSSVFSVLYGYFLFKEGGFRERLPGSILMVLGAILISIA